MAAFWRRAQERLVSLPGVLSAGVVNGGMLTGGMSLPGRTNEPLRVEGQPPKPTTVPALRLFVTPRFFGTMGIPLVAGRDFTEHDHQSAPRVVILTEAMARFYFGNESPIGRRVRFSGRDGVSTEIVGVIKDFVKGTPRGAGLADFTQYFPYRDREALNIGAQSRLRAMMLAVRTAGDPRAVATRVRQELRELDPGLPVLKIDTVDEQLDDVLARDRLMTILSGFFGALALLLACVGLYGVMAYTTARRTSEIGVRMALGASTRTVLSMVFRDGLWLVLIGLAIGVPCTLALTRLIASQLFGVSAADPLTICVTAFLVIAVAAIGAFLPARRASRVDPMIALRCE